MNRLISERKCKREANSYWVQRVLMVNNHRRPLIYPRIEEVQVISALVGDLLGIGQFWDWQIGRGFSFVTLLIQRNITSACVVSRQFSVTLYLKIMKEIM